MGGAENFIDFAVFSGLGVPGGCWKLQPSYSRLGSQLSTRMTGTTPVWDPYFMETLEGSFSAVSTATIARKDAFFSIFRDLQDLHSFAPLQTQKLSKQLLSISRFLLRNSQHVHFFLKFVGLYNDFDDFFRDFSRIPQVCALKMLANTALRRRSR